MKLNRFFIISIVLLFIISLGTVSAAEDLTIDDLTGSDNVFSSTDSEFCQDLSSHDGFFNEESISSISLDKSEYCDCGESNSSYETLREEISPNEKKINANTLTSSEVVVNSYDFFKYFDRDGTLKDDVNSDLVFKGSFNKVDKITINKPIMIRGENAFFTNIHFVISSDDVEMKDLNLIANNITGDLISIYSSNVNLTKLRISYFANDDDAIAINLTNADNVQITDSTINFESHLKTDMQSAIVINILNSSDIQINNNSISASLPTLYLTHYDLDNVIGLTTFSSIRVLGSSNIRFTKNDLNTTINNSTANLSSVQSIYIVDCENVLIGESNIAMEDTVSQEGQAVYNYAVTFYNSNGVNINKNNFSMFTVSGDENGGNSYLIRGLSSGLNITENNFISSSKGPNVCIYLDNRDNGDNFTVFMIDNYINLTGLAIDNSWGLVSAIEIQAGAYEIFNNTIYTFNLDEYNETDYLFGISSTQESNNASSLDIRNNTIVTTGKYAIFVNDAQDFFVIENDLIGHKLVGDASVFIGEYNFGIIENNTGNSKETPIIEIFAETVYSGEDNEIIITIKSVNGTLIPTGTVNVELNGKKETFDLIEGKVNHTFSANNFVYGENKIFVTYNGDINFMVTEANSTFFVLNYIVTNETFLDYFDQYNNYSLFDFIKPGVTLDFQGEFIGGYVLCINKAVNVISSTGNAIFDTGGLGSFNIVSGASYANITGIKFYNTPLYISNVSNVVIENIRSIANVENLGLYTGFISINDSSLFITLKDSYIENGGTAEDCIVIAKSSYCQIDNNTINITGSAKNAICFTSSVEIGSSPTHCNVTNNFIENNYNSFTCAAITISGAYHLIDNNTIKNMAKGIESQLEASDLEGFITYSNNKLIGESGLNAIGNSTVINNAIGGELCLNDGSLAEGNSINSLIINGHNSKLENNFINGTVIINGGANQLNLNTINGIITVNNDNNVIENNDVRTDNEYAIDLKQTRNNVVRDNVLFSALRSSDDAVSYNISNNNTVENNCPPYRPNIQIDAGIFWGIRNIDIPITVTNANGKEEVFAGGNVTVIVNGIEETVVLTEGKVIYTVSSLKLVARENNITVIYNGEDDFLTGENTAIFKVLDGVVTNETFFDYFNMSNKGRLCDYVPDGAILDFQGTFYSSKERNFTFELNRPVNIKSSTKDTFIDLNTTAGSLFGESPGDSFTISNGGSGSNVSDINFHNTQIWVYNAHNVTLDHISNTIEDQRVGSGNGATSIRANSTYVTVKNSYFYTRNNGGSSTLVIAWADYCTFDNNTVVVEGEVGNMIYLTTYNIDVPSGIVANVYNNITNNKLYGFKEATAICWGIVLRGANNLVEGNFINYSGVGIIQQWGASDSVNNSYINNVLIGGASMNAPAYSTIYGNNVSGGFGTGAGSIVFNNVLGDILIVDSNAAVYNNSAMELYNNGSGAKIYNNTINGPSSIGGNSQVISNNFNGNLKVSGEGAKLSNITLNGNSTINSKCVFIEDSIFYGDIIIGNRANATLVGNLIYGQVSTRSNSVDGTIIMNNFINTTEEYAVVLENDNNIVCDNQLYAKRSLADNAVSFIIESNNIVKDNHPFPPIITIFPSDSIVGEPIFIRVNLTDENHNVVNATVFLNVDGSYYRLEVFDGKGSISIGPINEIGYCFINMSFTQGQYILATANSSVFIYGLGNVTVKHTEDGDAADIQRAIDEASEGDVVRLGSYNYTDVASVNISKGLTIAGNEDTTIASLGDGNPIFNVLPIYEYGRESVTITGVCFKLNSRDTVVKATASNDTNPLSIVTPSINITENTFETIDDDVVPESITILELESERGILSPTGEICIYCNEIAAGVDPFYFKVTGIGSGGEVNIVPQNFTPEKKATVIVYSDMSTTAVDMALDGRVGEWFKFTLTDADGNPLANMPMEIGFNGKIYNYENDGIITDENGIAQLQINLGSIGSNTFAISFIGNDEYNASFAVARINVTAQKGSMSVPDKTYKASAKTKALTATLKSASGKAIKNKVITFDINGKIFTAKTDAKGVATVKVSISKKGTYKYTVKFANDVRYAAITKTAKLILF